MALQSLYRTPLTYTDEGLEAARRGLERLDLAMRGFVDNWDRHRGQLLSSIEKVGQMCAASAETFRCNDLALSQVIQSGDGEGR